MSNSDSRSSELTKEIAASELRKTGISIFGNIRWGTHFCYFYETKRDLLETLVLFFKAGLEDKEFCIWVVAQPLTVKEAKRALERAVPDLDRRLAEGDLEIHSFADWYLCNGQCHPERVLRRWSEKLEHALAKGYAGLRASGDGGWAQNDEWIAFREYEKQIDAMIEGQRSIILCTYPLTTSPGAKVFDVAHIHQVAVARRHGRWEMVETSELKQAKAEIKRLNDELEERVQERTAELRRVHEELQADITERKHAEEKLWQSLHLLRAITEGTTDAIFAKDREGRYLMINTAGARLVGKTPEEMIGLDDSQFFSEETRTRIIERDRAIMRTGETRTDENISTTLAGIGRIYLTTKGPLCDSTGAVIGLFGVSRDITERKQAEEALAEQAIRSKTLMETSADSIYVLNERGDLQEANAAFLRRRGYTATEAKGLNVADWDARYTREQLQERLRKLAGSSAVFETRHRCKDGSLFDVEVGVTSVRIGGKPLFFVVTRDITERKRVEESRRESQLRYETLVQSIDGIVWEADPETFMFTFVSKQAERILGYPLEQWFDGPGFWPDHMHPDDRDWALKFCVDATARGEDHQFEYRMIAADGRVVWLNDIVSLHIAPDQSVILRGVMVDITERKQAEERLRRSEEKFKTLFDLAPVGISVLDCQHNIVEVNPALEKIVRLSREELLRGSARRRTYLNADGTPKPLGEIASRRAIRENRSIDDIETGIVRENGEIIWTQVSAAPLTLPEASAVVITQDITERKRAERALRESETRFRQLAENIDEIFWITDLKGSSTIYISPAYERISGRSCESLYATPKSWRDDIHPEDRPRMEATFASDPGSTGDYTYRIVRPDGSIRWIRDRGFPVRDESEEVVRFAGIAEDITARKLAEEELQQVNEQLRILSRRLFQVQEDERRHLARELHDEIGQALTAAKINLESIESIEGSSQSLRLKETITLLNNLLRQVRQISLDLHSSLLDDLGLAPALRSLLDQQARRAGLRAQLYAAEPLGKIDSEIQTTGFRIVQEAITNVLRHAKAQGIGVYLQTEADQLRMKIVDDGSGFDLAEIEGRAHQGASFGLMGMRERAALVGGRLQIISTPKKGTTVEVSLPLSASGEAPPFSGPAHSRHEDKEPERKPGKRAATP